jgi:hypothetical protein
MTLYVSISHREPLWVKATADVAGGWGENENGHGFFARGSMPYPGDRSLEFTMNVRVRPRGILAEFVNFPLDLEITGELTDKLSPVGVYAVSRGKAGVAIMVPSLEGKLELHKDEPLYLDRLILAKGAKAHVRMMVSLGFCSAPAMPIGDIPEWDTQFFQGGLPSLGKRRP